MLSVKRDWTLIHDINIFRPMERNYYGANAVAHLLRTMRHIDY